MTLGNVVRHCFTEAYIAALFGALQFACEDFRSFGSAAVYRSLDYEILASKERKSQDFTWMPSQQDPPLFNQVSVRYNDHGGLYDAQIMFH